MKFGAKLADLTNINHFTQVIATIAKLCSKSTDKMCVMKLTQEKMYFIFTESCSISPGSGKTTFWMSLDPKLLFDLYICEGKSEEENFILLEFQPDTLHKALKSNQNAKNVRLRLTKRQTACLTVELDLPSVSKNNSRTITHDISVSVISASSFDFEEPNMSNTNLSIHLPPLKLFKHILERMKFLTDYIYLNANLDGDFTLKVETDLVQVSTYFKNLQTNQVDDQIDKVQVRLSMKKLFEFINSLQFQSTRMICNFINEKYAHFFVIHNDDVVLQYLIASIYN